MQTNRELLLDTFHQTLRQLDPSSVLDVGCGAGATLEQMRADGVPATGVEASAPRVTALRERGLDAVETTADRLPFEDRSFDWVTIRHVLHHLRAPVAALREAWRIARCGLLAAEPWNDPQIASQVAMTRVDAWLRARQTERGHVHLPNVTPATILEALRPARATVEIRLPLRPLSPADLQTLVEQALEGDAASGAAAAEQTAIEQLAEEGGVTLPGSAVVTCWKDGVAG